MDSNRLLCHWDVEVLPPQSHKVGPLYVPSLRSKVLRFAHQRRITLEIVSKLNLDEKDRQEIARAKLIGGLLKKQADSDGIVVEAANLVKEGTHRASSGIMKVGRFAGDGLDVAMDAGHTVMSSTFNALRHPRESLRRASSHRSLQNGTQAEDGSDQDGSTSILGSATTTVYNSTKEMATGVAKTTKNAAATAHGVLVQTNATVQQSISEQFESARNTLLPSRPTISPDIPEQREGQQRNPQSNSASANNTEQSSQTRPTSVLGLSPRQQNEDPEAKDETPSAGSFFVDHKGMGRGSILSLDDEIDKPQDIMKNELKPTDTLVIRILAKHKRSKNKKKKKKKKKNRSKKTLPKQRGRQAAQPGFDSSSSDSDDDNDDDGDDDDDDGSSSSSDDDDDEDSKTKKSQRKLTEAASKLICDEKSPTWSEKQLYVLDDIEIYRSKKRYVEMAIGRGNDAEVRRINFSSKDEADNFRSLLNYARRLQNTRAFRQDYSYRQSILDNEKEPKKADTVSVLVEIVSASNLPPSDRSSADPYVSVFLGQKIVHQTKEIPRHLNPIWTVLTGSLFILDVPTEDFFQASGLSFFIFDHDVLNADFLIGKVTVPHEDVLHGNGNRREYPLFTKKGSLFGAALALRFRPATEADTYFVRRLRRGSFQGAKRHTWKNCLTGVNAGTSTLPPRVHQLSFVKREARLNKKTKQREKRVQPWPDPLRVKTTKWMTKEQVTDECMKPGTHWVELGSGGIGSLYLEILHADSLPNLDTSHLGLMSGKSDPFCTIVFEDCVANTDVINDTCNPKWMPWGQRNFVFRITHPSSQLFLGLFDFDSESSVINHDQIGRVGVNLANFHAMMDYTLEYRLYNTANLFHRKSHGTVTVRLRIEWDDTRGALLHPRHQPTQFHVGIPKWSDFLSVHYTVHGEGAVDDLDLSLLMAYWDELWGLVNLVDPIRDTMWGILCWRGHYPLSVPHVCYNKGFKVAYKRIKLPLNSFIAFLAATRLAENFNLIPAYVCFGGAWFLLSMMGRRQKPASPWQRCRTYSEMITSFVLGKSLGSEIKPDTSFSVEKASPPKADDDSDELDRQTKVVTKQVEKEKRRLWREVEKEEHKNVSSKKSSGSIIGQVNPLKPYLWMVQQYLARYCSYVRTARGIVEWDDSYSAFFFTNALIAVGLLFMVVPWDVVVRWIMRTAAWVFLGPWMYFVDLLYFESWKDINRERKIKKILEISQALEKERQEVRSQNEKALKMHDMINFYFGKFVVSAPRFKEYIHRDMPLDSSFAIPAEERKNPRIIKKVDGQRLEGEMIPKWVGAGNWDVGLATGLEPEDVDSDSDDTATTSDESPIETVDLSTSSRKKVLEKSGLTRSMRTIAEEEASPILPSEVLIERAPATRSSLAEERGAHGAPTSHRGSVTFADEIVEIEPPSRSWSFWGEPKRPV